MRDIEIEWYNSDDSRLWEEVCSMAVEGEEQWE